MIKNNENRPHLSSYFRTKLWKVESRSELPRGLGAKYKTGLWALFESIEDLIKIEFGFFPLREWEAWSERSKIQSSTPTNPTSSTVLLNFDYLKIIRRLSQLNFRSFLSD